MKCIKCGSELNGNYCTLCGFDNREGTFWSCSRSRSYYEKLKRQAKERQEKQTPPPAPQPAVNPAPQTTPGAAQPYTAPQQNTAAAYPYGASQTVSPSAAAGANSSGSKMDGSVVYVSKKPGASTFLGILFGFLSYLVMTREIEHLLFRAFRIFPFRDKTYVFISLALGLASIIFLIRSIRRSQRTGGKVFRWLLLITMIVLEVLYVLSLFGVIE